MGAKSCGVLSLLTDLAALPTWLLCSVPVALFVFGVVLILPYLKKWEANSKFPIDK